MEKLERVNLSKLKNCNQVWDSMKPLGCGRHCEKCDKVIVDFRNMSHTEVAEKHAFSSETICGVYLDAQLEIPKSVEPKQSNTGFKTIYLAVLGLLFHEVADAQTVVQKPNQIQTDRVTKPSALSEAIENKYVRKADSLVFHGTVFDENNEPIPYVMVIIQGTQTGVSTDFDGKFQIDLTQALDTADQHFLEFKMIGYVTQQVAIKENSGREINIHFNTGEVIAFGVTIAPTPIHKRFWYKTKNLFRRKNN